MYVQLYIHYLLCSRVKTTVKFYTWNLTLPIPIQQYGKQWKFLVCVFQAGDKLEELFETCMKLAESTRPQDCTTSAYMLRYLIQLPQLDHILQEKLGNTCTLVCIYNTAVYLSVYDDTLSCLLILVAEYNIRRGYYFL